MPPDFGPGVLFFTAVTVSRYRQGSRLGSRNRYNRSMTVSPVSTPALPGLGDDSPPSATGPKDPSAAATTAPGPRFPAPKPDGAYRLLHTADIHLGKTLVEQSREDDHRRFVEWLLEAVDTHEVDAVLIAGDVFDSANPPTTAEALYYRLLGALHQRQIPAVVVAGNHDSPSHLRSSTAVLEPLSHHVRTDLCNPRDTQIVILPNPTCPAVAVAAVPYLREGDLRSLAPAEAIDPSPEALVAAGWQCLWKELEEAVDRVAPGLPAIATGHLTVLGGTTNRETEREIRIGGLGDVDPAVFPDRFAYVALGHLHRPQAHGRGGRLRYSGSPVALGFSEGNVPREVRLVDFIPGGTIFDQPLPVDDTRRLISLRCRHAELRAELERIHPPVPGAMEPWIDVELTDPDLFADPERVAAEVRQMGKDRGLMVLTVRRDSSAMGPSPTQGRTVDELMTELDAVKADPLTTMARLIDSLPEPIDPTERHALLQLLAEEILMETEAH